MADRKPFLLRVDPALLDAVQRWANDERGPSLANSAVLARALGVSMDALLYGEDHPYTTHAVVTPADAAAIGYDRVTGFKRAYFTAGHATLILVGRFDPVRAEALVRKYFGHWDRGASSKPMSGC